MIYRSKMVNYFSVLVILVILAKILFMEKQCFKCKLVKPLTDFYKHPQMGDGYLNKCKECNKKDVKGNYLDNIKKDGYIDKERKRGRQKYHRLYAGTGKAKPEDNKRWAQKYPEKTKAASMAGSLKKPFAEAERHHWSYNDEHFKDVIWLTKKHHNKAHRFIVYDQERKMYRRYDDNILLDTKEKHEEFIKWCIATKED